MYAIYALCITSCISDANPTGAGHRCFNTARTVAQGCVAAGGYVGLYLMNSGDPSWIRIMNSGSRTTYSKNIIL